MKPLILVIAIALLIILAAPTPALAQSYAYYGTYSYSPHAPTYPQYGPIYPVDIYPPRSITVYAYPVAVDPWGGVHGGRVYRGRGYGRGW